MARPYTNHCTTTAYLCLGNGFVNKVFCFIFLFVSLLVYLSYAPKGLYVLLKNSPTMTDKTWEYIVKPAQPIPFSELEVVVTEGESLHFPLKRQEIQQSILRYWDDVQQRMFMARSGEFTDALAQKDEAKIKRMLNQVGGVHEKYRLTRAMLEDNKLYLALSLTDYMSFAGTNERAIREPEFREMVMRYGIEDRCDANFYFANPLAVCSVFYGYNTLGDDSSIYVPIGLRSDKVAIYPNVHHVVGGVIDVAKKGQQIDIARHLKVELGEEMGVDATQMGEPLFYGIVRQIPSRMPEVVCGIPIYVGQEELMRRWKEKAPGKFEHRNLSFYRVCEIPEFLEKHGGSMVPSGAAALTIFLEQQKL